jgi:hypothetical protein
MAETQLPPFLDRPEVSESFADAIYSVTGAAGVISIALSALRSVEGNPPSFNRVLSSRIVLTVPAALDLHQRLGAMLVTLQKQGQLQLPTPGGGGPPR